MVRWDEDRSIAVSGMRVNLALWKLRNGVCYRMDFQMSSIPFSDSRNPRFENLLLSCLEILETRLWRICIFFDMIRKVDSHQQVIIAPRNAKGFRIRYGNLVM